MLSDFSTKREKLASAGSAALQAPAAMHAARSRIIKRASFCTQFKVLVGRNIKNDVRNPQLLAGRVGMGLFFMLLLNLMYFGKGDKIKAITDIVHIRDFSGAVFMLNMCFFMNGLMPTL